MRRRLTAGRIADVAHTWLVWGLLLMTAVSTVWATMEGLSVL